jgi:hypothetical protein
MTDDARGSGPSGRAASQGRRRDKPQQKRSTRVEIDGWINLSQ